MYEIIEVIISDVITMPFLEAHHQRHLVQELMLQLIDLEIITLVIPLLKGVLVRTIRIQVITEIYGEVQVNEHQLR